MIIGHTTATGSRIWLRGAQQASHVELVVTGEDAIRTFSLELDKENFYIGVVQAEGLQADTNYRCTASFYSSDRVSVGDVAWLQAQGSFRTARNPGEKKQLSFLFGSCNLHSTGFFMNPDRPFRKLRAIADTVQADFVLFCGDQIYYDIPDIWKHPDVNEYRKKYLDAWGECLPARELLANIPSYMILDDHEMVDNFSNDMDARNNLASVEKIREHSLQAYREFQHCRNPQCFGDDRYYYEFNWNGYPFFVLDTRTERRAQAPGSCLLGEDQLLAFKTWLLENRDAPKFVVCGVPFVAEVIVSDDKWSGAPFRSQREQIMSFLLEEGIDNLVILTGDMHHSYYAKMEISSNSSRRKIRIHELMSSPVNNRVRRDFDVQYANGIEHRSEQHGLTYITEIQQQDIYTGYPNVTLVRAEEGEVRFEIHRTRDGLLGWLEGSNPVRQGRIQVR